jgi:hypothetical protein
MLARPLATRENRPVPRLPILESTIKQLYGTATICAYPDCPEPLLRWINGVETPVLNSRIAHIAAASERGPRYNANMTDEDRRAFENLLLLCLPHAEEIDLQALADRYPPEALHRWKATQLQAAPAEPPIIPEGLLERAVLLSMGDVLMDFREANIDLGGKPAQAPGAGGSGGGAIGPGARGGDGGPRGSMNTVTVTGAQVLGEVPIEIGHPGRGGVDGMPGEAGGHTRVGTLVSPGGGRQTHTAFPAAFADSVQTSVSAAVLANYAELTNGLVFLAGAGWSAYFVDELPTGFSGGLCVWVDISWKDLEPGNEIPVEVIAELVTPSKTATFSKIAAVNLVVEATEGFVRHPLLISLAGTVHDQGRHILNVSTNTGSYLGQYLDIAFRNQPAPPDEAAGD